MIFPTCFRHLVAVVCVFLLWSTSPVFAQGAGLTSNDFNTCAWPSVQWTTVDPLGGGVVSVTGVGTSEAQLSIAVPGGMSHDPYNTNLATRVMQSASDEDFQVEVRFDTLPTERYQLQGVIVEQDADDWLRFDVY
jgi:hypothetical protein